LDEFMGPAGGHPLPHAPSRPLLAQPLAPRVVAHRLRTGARVRVVLALRGESPALGNRAVAVPLLELRAVGRRLAGHVQTSPAVAGHEAEEAVAERHRPPLLVRARRGADAPELDLRAVARGSRAAGHVQAQI